MPVYEAKPETLRDVADTNPAPQPTRETGPTVERLCEHDEEGTSGCRRTTTMLALEAEFDTFVHPEMYWGFWDQFCQHEGHIYYYKGWITDNVNRDVTNTNTPEVQAELDKLSSEFPNFVNPIVSADAIRNLFVTGVTGLPALVSETPNFFECEDIGTQTVSIDTLDRATLNLIKNTFTSEYHPFTANLADSLYLFNGKVFCSDVTAYEDIPGSKLGVLMIPNATEKYQVGKPYFFPFETLTAHQVEVITAIANIESEFAGPVTIIDL